MAAYESLLSLMQVIHDLETHPSPPISLDKQLLDSITQRITFFQEFLHSYNYPPPPVTEDDEEAFDPLEMRIADAAHTAENIIECHIMESIQLQRSNNNTEKENDEKIASLYRDRLLSLIVEMDSIKKVVVDTEKTKNEAPVDHDQVATTKDLTSVSRNETEVESDDVSLESNETEVESDDVSLEIMEKLTGGRSNRQVIPIVGMGGIGKTFLAKTIYAKPLVKEHFDTCAWATISQQHNTREIFCELLYQATNTKKEQLSGKSEDVLGSELHKTLFGRRFLIVMDDIWSIDAWDKIQRFFPSNENGSRVLVTTRLSHLCSQLNNDYSLPMSFLDKSHSWDLFSKTVFGEKSCPSKLKEIGEKIVEKCRGLPLSIVVVGGLLKKMDNTRASWESIHGNLTSVVNTENDKHCLRLLKMSYNYLPVYLKPCCLHMGLFGEDEEIRVSRLVNLWVSEGFLRPRNGESLETTARGFLQHLIDRNLVLIGKLGHSRSIKFCKMHDLVRDMCLKEGKKQGFYHVMEQSNLLTQDMNTHRRVVIPWKSSRRYDFGESRYMSPTRSITCYGELSPSLNLGLLRTLHSLLWGYDSGIIDERYANFLSYHHVNLRHLAIDVSGRCVFLHTFHQFWNLHTLVVSGSAKALVVVDFWIMPRLRHIEILSPIFCILDPPSCHERDVDGDAVVVMENLHTLKGVKNLKCSEDIVERIPNVKILKMEYIAFKKGSNDEDEEYCVENIKHLCRLESLSIGVTSVSLRNKPTFPHSLKKLSLSTDNEHEWEGMLDCVGSLPLLEKLKLSWGKLGNGKWEVVEGQFPRLKYLELSRCWGVEHWTVAEEGSDIFPRLEHLRLHVVSSLETIPLELGNINTLKEIRLNYCGEGAVMSAKEMFDEQVDSQGGADQLCFRVVVKLREEHQHLMSLADTNFQVIPYAYSISRD